MEIMERKKDKRLCGRNGYTHLVVRDSLLPLFSLHPPPPPEKGQGDRADFSYFLLLFLTFILVRCPMAGRRTSLQPPPTFKLLRKEEPSGSSASGHLGLAKRRRKRRKRAQKHSPLQNKMKEERETRNKDVANEVKRKRQKRKQKGAIFFRL